MQSVRDLYNFPDHPFVVAASNPVVAELLEHVLDSAAQGYFVPEKCRAFLDIVWSLHNYTISIPDEEYSTEAVMNELKRLTTLYSVNHPPKCC